MNFLKRKKMPELEGRTQPAPATKSDVKKLTHWVEFTASIVIGSAVGALACQIFNDTATAFGVKFAIKAPRGVHTAGAPGRYIFSGEGLTVYGALSNKLSDKLKEKLGDEGADYGYIEPGGGYLNFLRMETLGNERALALVQDDSFANKSDPDLNAAKKNVKVLLRPKIYEAVFMASGRADLQTLTDVVNEASRSERNKHKPLVIATPSAHITGSYYTAGNIQSLLGGERNIEIRDYTTVRRALEATQLGDADIALFVAYPGMTKDDTSGAPRLLRDFNLHLLPANIESYRSAFSHSPYSLVEVTNKELTPDPMQYLATPIDIIGREPKTIADSATRHGVAYFDDRIAQEITDHDLAIKDSIALKFIAVPSAH